MSVTIHTDATGGIFALAALEGIEVIAGTARGDHEPDCMYGWFEPQDQPDCRPHTMIVVDDIRLAPGITRGLVMNGCQAVVTSSTDYSEVIPVGASCYFDAHQH